MSNLEEILNDLEEIIPRLDNVTTLVTKGDQTSQVNGFQMANLLLDAYSQIHISLESNPGSFYMTQRDRCMDNPDFANFCSSNGATDDIPFVNDVWRKTIGAYRSDPEENLGFAVNIARAFEPFIDEPVMYELLFEYHSNLFEGVGDICDARLALKYLRKSNEEEPNMIRGISLAGNLALLTKDESHLINMRNRVRKINGVDIDLHEAHLNLFFYKFNMDDANLARRFLLSAYTQLLEFGKTINEDEDESLLGSFYRLFAETVSTVAIGEKDEDIRTDLWLQADRAYDRLLKLGVDEHEIYMGASMVKSNLSGLLGNDEYSKQSYFLANRSHLEDYESFPDSDDGLEGGHSLG